MWNNEIAKISFPEKNSGCENGASNKRCHNDPHLQITGKFQYFAYSLSKVCPKFNVTRIPASNLFELNTSDLFSQLFMIASLKAPA